MSDIVFGAVVGAVVGFLLADWHHLKRVDDLLLDLTVIQSQLDTLEAVCEERPGSTTTKPRLSAHYGTLVRRCSTCTL